VKVFVHESRALSNLSTVPPSHIAYSIISEGFRIDITLIETEKLLPHEETITKNLEGLLEDIIRSGSLKSPVIVDGKSLVVLDGMHRVEVMRLLDCRFSCVCLVDYMSPQIKVDRWCRVVSRPIDIDKFNSRFGELRAVTTHEDISGIFLMLEEGNFQLMPPGQEVLSSFNKVSSIEAWLSEKDFTVCYETETNAAGMLERHEISFVLCPPMIQKQNVMEITKSGLVFIPKATRHIFPARLFGVNVPLDLLQDKNISIEEANRKLSMMLKEKTLTRVPPENAQEQGKYEEIIYVFE
jgi:hypothetical protein